MAGLLPLLVFFSILFLINLPQAQSSYNNVADPLLLLPIVKHGTSLQYLTKINLQNNGLVGPIDLVLDLGGPFLWMHHSETSSARLISLNSIQCLAAKPSMVRSTSSLSEVCDIFPENRITQMGIRGELVEDTISIPSKSSSGSVISVCLSFLLGSAPSSLLNGLAMGARGTLGLGRHRISLPSQIAAAFGSKLQFSLCLSSSDGVVAFENHLSKSYFGSELSRSLIYTPLLKTQLADSSSNSKHDYFINLQSIKINGRTLSLQKSLQGGTKLSTIVPYTTMESSIFATFSKAYERAAMAMDMKRVQPVSPFGLCFSTKGIQETVVGPEVPEIDLVLQSKMVKWRIHGRNSMVKVSNETMCLGFIDGGSELKSSIILGGYQLEDILVHFDVGASRLGFSPSLLLKQRSCSDFQLGSMPMESL